MSINKVFCSGNATRDLELRMTASGNAIGSFGIAVNDRIKNNQTGQWEDRPNFFDCVMFGPRAQSLQQYLTKGTKVSIEGKLRYNTWQDKNGQKRSKVEIVVEEIEFMSRFQNQGQGYQQPRQQGYQQQPNQGYQQEPQYVEATVYDGYESSEIPF